MLDPGLCHLVHPQLSSKLPLLRPLHLPQGILQHSARDPLLQDTFSGSPPSPRSAGAPICPEHLSCHRTATCLRRDTCELPEGRALAVCVLLHTSTCGTGRSRAVSLERCRPAEGLRKTQLPPFLRTLPYLSCTTGSAGFPGPVKCLRPGNAGDP